jgi:hypothetical protein
MFTEQPFLWNSPKLFCLVPPPLGRTPRLWRATLGGGTPALTEHPESLTPTLSLREREQIRFL